jgi:hypothetical protein
VAIDVNTADNGNVRVLLQLPRHEELAGAVMTWRVFGAFITSCSLHKATARSYGGASSSRIFHTA